MTNIDNKRVLIIDDNKEIHDDFLKILLPKETATAMAAAEMALFGLAEKPQEDLSNCILHSAYQGQEGFELVQKAVAKNEPYAMAFVDTRMPPGWDGVKTIQKIWEIDPQIQTVICSAHSDYTWEDIKNVLGGSDRLLILKKPFEVLEIQQLVCALIQKWNLNRQVQNHVSNLESLVKDRTKELEKSLSLTKATLESTAEGIFVISTDNKIIDYNNKFLEIWEIPEAILQQQESAMVLRRLASQVENGGNFIQALAKVQEQLELESLKEWQLKNGKILELFTHPQLVKDQIIGTVYSFRDVSERKALEAQLLYQATHDSLTGLPNRALLLDRIQQAIISAKRYGHRIGIYFFDIDNFKRINDSLGHSAGDEFIKLVAQRLSDSVRAVDTVGRLGGDEFVVVVGNQTCQDSIVTVANKLLKSIVKPYKIDNHELISSASIGISIYPTDGEDAETLLKHADSALYLAKEKRNQYQLYTPELSERILKKVELESALRTAITNNEFFLNYQPLLDLQTGRVIGVEALLRWKHPELGELLPIDFLKTAEETFLILPIGEWVLRTACAQHVAWQEFLDSPLAMAVNISVNQFRDDNFIYMIKTVIKETGIDPQFLELELKESLLLDAPTEVISKMHELKDLGVRLVVDNFGAGYVSLNYFKNLPFDKVKIDKSFVRNITTNSDDSAIVQSIIELSKYLNLQVLAQGVETKEQVDYLSSHLVGQVEGHYYGDPLDSREFLKLIQNNKPKNT